MSIIQSSMPALGLVCVTSSEEIRYRTVTRKRLLTLSDRERQQVLHELYESNIEVLRRALHFCEAQRLTLYRLSSSLFPFSDEPYGARVLERFHEPLHDIGRLARTLAIRLVMHPDQYVVLSSDSESVIGNSIKILTAQARVLDALDQPRTAWAALQLHGGKAGRARKLIETIKTLEESIRLRLALENDEYAFSAQEILEICTEARLPMVFDAHHHLVHEQLDSYEHPSMRHFVEAAARTWPRPEWQLVHISNGRTAFADSSHSDFIQVLPSAYWQAPYIEVEAKAKEQAIARIRKLWKRPH
jgi:UV DNA damage endonuclease